MSEWSDDKAATALRLISKHGQTMTLSRNAPGGQSGTGDRPAPDVLASAAGVFIPGRDPQPNRIMLSATDPSPAIGDFVGVPSGPNAGVHAVEGLKLMAPDGNLIASELVVKR